LPTNLRAKWFKVSFRFPIKVQKVNFTNLQQENKVLSLKDITDFESLNKAAQQWIGSAPPEIKYGENGYADCDIKKRKVEWTCKDVKGGQSRTLELVLSFDKETEIDEHQIK